MVWTPEIPSTQISILGSYQCDSSDTDSEGEDEDIHWSSKTVDGTMSYQLEDGPDDENDNEEDDEEGWGTSEIPPTEYFLENFKRDISFMLESQSKSVEDLKKSDSLSDQLVNASREVFEDLGTSEDPKLKDSDIITYLNLTW